LAGSKTAKAKRPRKLSIDAVVLATIEKHAYSILDAEVGGMLFGDVEGGITKIVGSVPASKASAEQISLTFTHEVWEDILKQGEELFPGMRIVGWYHTHPSFGLFLSEYDAFIQQNFFSSPGQVALVIDPIAGDMGWFVQNQKTNKIDNIFTEPTVTGPRRPPKTQVEVSPPKQAYKFLLTGLASALLAGGAAYGIANMSVPVDQSAQVLEQRSELDALNLEMAQATGQPPYLYTVGYVVSKGETLRSITDKFFGKGADESLITRYNAQIQKGKVAENDHLLIVAPLNMFAAQRSN